MATTGTSTRPTSVDECREAYLAFFAARGHARVASDSLVPASDPSLLFTGAGMNQFKDLFLGKGPFPYRRATSSQKCLRTQDLDVVGTTAFHHTFFEMLGNFSFGDYFKREAITWAWEFLTGVLGMPKDRLRVSVYQEDAEAYDIWVKEAKLPPDRIARLGPKSNFWPANAPKDGPNGPCGPCSEIFWDFGGGCGRPECGVDCDCGRFAEIWNLVFTQFDRRDGGVLQPLPQTNIDTGMGLERLTMVMQGKSTNFETDLFRPITEAVDAAVGHRCSAPAEVVKQRRIADHARAATFCLADGVLPSNEGRGYVLRKVIRRAVRDGRSLGAPGAFLHTLAPVVARVMRRPYPELTERQDQIVRTLKAEEDRFLETLARGSERIQELIRRVRADGRDPKGAAPAPAAIVSGQDAFTLYDTHGIPLDVAEPMLEEAGLKVDREGYDKAMAAHQAKSREGSGIAAEIFDRGPAAAFLDLSTATAFLGYDTLESDATVLGILRGKTLAPQAGTGDAVEVLLDRSPFYGEGGGQVGDSGALRGPSGEVEVRDTLRIGTRLRHVGVVRAGTIRTGDRVVARVDAERRRQVAAHHTATHLLHAVLRKELGPHVMQQGSLVAADRLRFDFSHPERLDPDLLAHLETLVNRHIAANLPRRNEEMSFQAAKELGALAFFGDKYGDRVRICGYGDVSIELCGGTHVAATGEIGLFTLVGEGAVAAGVRRVEAVTGPTAIQRIQETRRTLQAVSGLLKAPPEKVVERVDALLKEQRAGERRAAERRGADAAAAGAGMASRFETIQGRSVCVADAGALGAEELRTAADQARKAGAVAVLLAATADGKAALVAMSSLPSVDAREWIKDVAPLVKGGGGGKADVAQAGGKDPAGVPAALERARAFLIAKLGPP